MGGLVLVGAHISGLDPRKRGGIVLALLEEYERPHLSVWDHSINIKVE